MTVDRGTGGGEGGWTMPSPIERAEAERQAQGLPGRVADAGALAKAVALLRSGS